MATPSSAEKTSRATKTKPKTTTTKRKTAATKGTSSAGRGKLIIVESPAKARTISRYLGRGYTVKASMGHIRDLPKSSLGVEVDAGFAPKYLIPRDKSKVVKELKESVQGAKEIYLATDPDREGEAIAWHLVHATEAENKPIHRVVFHEITPDAVTSAIENPREIDMDLVDAQQARRVLDRLVGYKVSPLLWKKVKRGLSAGRVQSAALRIVVEREREIDQFQPVEYWSLDADLAKITGQEPTKKDILRASIHQIRGKKAELSTGEQAHGIVEALDGAVWQVASVVRRETRRNPQAPFTTSTLQQEASRKLSFSVRRTMQIAQELYEGVDLGAEGTQGLITYMRTDSVNISSSVQQATRPVIAQKFGSEYVPDKPPFYRTKSKGAQEAHEAIRPTVPGRDPLSVKPFLSGPQFKLYQLVWQRFMASQMAPARLDNTRADIAAGQEAEIARGEQPFVFRATGSIVTFPGWMAVYQRGRDEGDTDELDRGALPELAEGEALNLLKLLPEQHFTQPPPRFTEATLVKALEEQGIGRPSTYVPTIATLQARNYVTLEERKLIPTELGLVVNDLLVEHFPNIFDIGFTSQLEGELDDIASGEREWVPTLEQFYQPFTETLQRAEQTMERVKIRDEPTDEVCEKCGRPMVIKLGKFGKFLACSGFPECRNSKPLLTRIGVECPTCHQGEVVERRSKKGRKFYGCERFPECDFVSWNKPTTKSCANCGAYMVEVGRGNQLKCSACNSTTPALAKAGD
ncbi:MAG TPA: type I DNA topoisomerase [Thermomicrobiales bacterium]|nr:type I DNA topoisomerase [Thermomicrobiales bacterium]